MILVCYFLAIWNLDTKLEGYKSITLYNINLHFFFTFWENYWGKVKSFRQAVNHKEGLMKDPWPVNIWVILMLPHINTSWDLSLWTTQTGKLHVLSPGAPSGYCLPFSEIMWEQHAREKAVFRRNRSCQDAVQWHWTLQTLAERSHRLCSSPPMSCLPTSLPGLLNRQCWLCEDCSLCFRRWAGYL